MATTKQKIQAFINKWQQAGKGKELQDTHPFWEELVEIILDVPHGRDCLDYEKPAPATVVSVEDGKNFKRIDVYVKTSKCLIEQKSRGIHLTTDKKASYINDQGQTIKLTALEQANLYYNRLNRSEQGRYYLACNFDEFCVVDNENKGSNYIWFRLEDLKDYIRILRQVLSCEEKTEVKEKDAKQDAAAKTASGFVKKLYDLLLKQYTKKEQTSEVLHQINVFCVRVVFCLYADAAELFDDEQFHTFLKAFNADKLQEKFKWLFIALDKDTNREPSLDAEILAFPYVNGGLFHDVVGIPKISEDIRSLIINSIEGMVMADKDKTPFNWSEISPTNFGCIFESTLDAKTRQKNGMHYTSPECIHKLIDPLFLNNLNEELDSILALPYESKKEKVERDKLLVAFHDKIANMNFLDPACGSGNFLTETFKSLRRIEIRILKELPNMGMGNTYTGGNVMCPLKVSIKRFYGIEIVDFAAQVARAALWISDCQMKQEAEDALSVLFNDKLPLISDNKNIRCADALRIDWNDVIKARKLSYIIGNPPFEGSKMLVDEQKSSVALAMMAKDEKDKPIWKKYGTMDFVCAWYAKAAEYMQQNKKIRTAFVSTNSIVQGEQVALLWKPLCNHYDLKIDFAWRSFVWESDSKDKAKVHCIIVAFRLGRRLKTEKCHIYQEDKEPIVCDMINSYLLPAEQLFIESRTKPLTEGIPEIGIGNKPIDDGNYLFTEDEKWDFIEKEPASEPYFREWYGADEFINGTKRYCLYLAECPSEELSKMPLCRERVQRVIDYRRNSKSEQTRELADSPMTFHVVNMPKQDYIVIPESSSERRKYIPMGFMSPTVMCSNAIKIISDGSLYHFAILQSRIHMAWVKVVCGRLKSDYRYSGRIVYYNFPWPANISSDLISEIYNTGYGIISARQKHIDTSLATLYNPVTMPENLTKAHKINDKAVFKAYSYLGINSDMTDEEIALALLRESIRLSTKPKKKRKSKKKTKKLKKSKKTITTKS